MDANAYPHLVALLEGRLSMYALEQWPLVKLELANYERDVEALREYAATLLAIHEGKDEDAARRVVAVIKAPR